MKVVNLCRKSHLKQNLLETVAGSFYNYTLKDQFLFVAIE